jgi:hypothetical protein
VARARDVSLFHNVQTGFEAHVTSCPMGVEGYFPKDKLDGA